MATVKQLLKEASNANFDDFSSKVEALLEVVLEHNFGHEEARLYSDFIQKCLHTFVTKLKGLQNEDQVEEVLKTGIICGGAYRHLLSSLERDEKHVVPSLLYHVVHSIQDRIQTFADYVISISDLAYQILDAIGFPKSAHTIACAFHGYLWNSSSKLLKQGSCQTVKQVLILRKISLLFICCLPEKSKIVSMLQYVITHYTQYNKDWEDEGTSKTLYGIFQDISDKLRDKNDTDEEKTACDRLVVQIQALLVEYLLKTSDYVKAKEIIKVMSALCDSCSAFRGVVDCYLYSVTNQEALQSSQKSDICIAKLKDTNSKMNKDIQSGQREELKVLFRALVNFVQSLSSKQLGSLDAGLVNELTQSCKILMKLCTKLQSECKNMLKKETDKGKLKELSDENVEYVTVSLQGYYRQLQFMQKMIEANSDEGLCGECVSMAEKFQQCLEDSVSVLSKKTENNHRCNLGYVSSVTGSACMQAGNYEMAANLYKIAVNQLYRFQQPTLIKVFEKLVDCYIHMEKWKEAVEVVYQALFTVEGGLKQVLAIWIKLKKEASNKEVFFQSLTLNGVLKSSSKEVKGISGRQLLLAEYQAWKQISRRQYIIEYHILDELLNTTETPVQKAEVLVALAATMCITGYNTHDMSASDMLDRAIVLFDENLVGSESSLAVACYTKYILLHEEAVEYMKNDTGEVEYFGKRDISENSRFTLQQEQDNLPLLVRAIELWEKSLGPNKNGGQSSSNGAKSRKAVGRKSEVVEATETLFGVEHHVDTLIMCGTRLITMKQPQLALRALEVAKEQLSYVKDSKRASDLSIQLSRGLMLLSRYDEAETVVDCKGDNRKNPTPLCQSLLLSELYILTGKRETGLKILQSILDSNDLLGKTQKVYFIQGTAKRLLSVALCLPGSGHMIKSANQYLLSLAFEAVQCHFTVINYLTKNKTLDQNADKWLILNEMLSSILHLCQLCRFIGLPREALCYLKAGLNISQGQGLPRWSCEFLVEMLGVQSLEADNERALLTAESLDCILSTENQSKNNKLNQSRKGSKSNNQSSDKQSALFISNENDNFGFQDPADSMKMDSDTTEKTPERVYVKKELDSEKKNKMRKMKTPDCTCMVEKYDLCPDVVRHRLCMKAGIVFSDFLAQTDMRNIADKLLSEVQTKFDVMMSFDSNTADMSTKHVSTAINGHMLDPQVLYSHLEACCIKAESYLHQKNFHKVHQIWKTFQNLEQSGNLSNVVHSSILLTRLALCDAAGYMLSLHGDKSESVTKINQSDTDESITDIAKKLERQSLKPRRKVSFESEIEKPTLTGTSVKKLKKKLARDTIDMKTPLKPAIALVNTPKFSARKTRNPLTTPSANRMDVLQKLMASDEEDDLIVFPDLKPVTPKVNLKSSKSSRVKAMCLTEPRNPSSKKPASVKAENPIACKLDFLLQNNDEENSDELEKEKKSGKQSKKRQNSVVSSVNDGKDCPCENSVVKNSTRKSKIVKKKSALDQTNQTGKNIVSNSDLSVRFDENEKVLTEKGTSDNELKVENKNGYHSQFKGDVFDFEMEASPDVGKATKTGKGRGKSKLSQKKKMANVSSKVSNNAENDDIQADDKENEKAPEVRRSTRRCQTKTETDNTELVRRNSDSSDYSDLEISLEELTFDNDTDNVDLSQENSDVELSEPVNTKDWLETNHISTLESSEEPTEIMRGKSSSKTKTKKSGSCVEKAAVSNNTDQGTEGNSYGEDAHNTSRSVEQMRSARLASMNDLVNILDPDDQPSVSCIEMPLSGETSPCGADIIPTLQSLYERLCHFPPNPQHSDVCHMLALHYLEKDPRKAAFLLSDASAVTFRHQVMLNIAKKARKVAKESIAAAGGNVSTSNTIMFGRDDLRLPDILTSIPEDWCVVQLSVVSVGLPWKQMILTRFAKDKDPVIVKLPGFSSPQGCHILKDFSQIMESNAETAGITSTAEWWSARRKLDADMESLVERIEKHWLGHWRHTLLPGEYPKRVLDLACKDIGKVAQKDVKTADIELLLLAGKVLSEKELKQCVSDVVGPDVLSCHGDSIVSVLKKYSSLGVDNEKQHTILILDKSVQHLPWESIPILSDRSVSRMPCLSHLIMQLADHQTRNHSVFIKGVNPKNTFYILNPDSDLQRTQDFFKNWFESEKDWSGVIGCRPTSEQFIDALTKKDFFIYCGHGSGGRIFTSDDIEKLTARAVTMLMGCSSGRLVVKGQFEPSGMMISYFLAGCPSMVANLWDVTDKDIDKFTEEVIKTWISSADGTYLPKLVQKSRAVCKLKYLNGLAPVVYGLPVFINKGKK